MKINVITVLIILLFSTSYLFADKTEHKHNHNTGHSHGPKNKKDAEECKLEHKNPKLKETKQHIEKCHGGHKH